MLALGMLASACSASNDITLGAPSPEPSQERAEIAAEEPTAEPAPDPTPLPEPTAPEPTAIAEPTPLPEPTAAPERLLWGDLLAVGDCFNRPEDPTTEPPEIVDCNERHEEELFAVGTFDDGPDAPYPGDENMVDLIGEALCDQATIDFVGTEWDSTPVPIYTLYADEGEWAAGSRFMGCSAAAANEGAQKIGTAAGSGLVSDDIIVGRAPILTDGVTNEDFLVLGQFSDLGSAGTLTDLQFDLPLRPAFPIGRGFLFTAKAFGDDGHATKTYGYDWRSQEITDLGSVLPGYELASPIITEGNVVIVAARATPNDDWDLWRSTNGGNDPAVPLADGEGHQHFPALTPDGEDIVFNDNGGLWVIGVDGTNQRQLTPEGQTAWESSISPDGQTVLYAATVEGQDDIFAIGIDGGEPVNLTDHPADEFWPTFSPDGERIYFSTDRLQKDPENNDSRHMQMVMNADGTDASWFGLTQVAQAFVIDPDIAEQVKWTSPTLVERHNYDIVQGEPDTTVTWEHSGGQLLADLPVGWRVAELDEAEGFVAGPRVEAFFDIWEADGVLVERVADLTKDEFFALYDELIVVQNCEQFDGSDGIQQADQTTSIISANFTCGDYDAVAGAIMIFNEATASGVIIEGQRDNWPDAGADEALLLEIARSVLWS